MIDRPPGRRDQVPEDEMAAGSTWRPGRADRLRAFSRRIIRGTFGDRGEERLHATYHRGLRSIGRFGPPEDDGSIALLGSIAQRSRTIIDIGANAGRYAWFLRRHARPDARLYALEPDPASARLLRATLRGLPGATILELGASDRDGRAALRVPVGAFGSPVSGLGWVQSPSNADQKGTVEIDVRRLDGLIDDGTVSLAGPVFIKIDVEGGEGEALRGAAASLRRHRPIVYFECQAATLARHGETPAQVWREFERLGYRIMASRRGNLVPMANVDDTVVNYVGIPDLGDFSSDLRIGGPELDGLLDDWAVRNAPA